MVCAAEFSSSVTIQLPSHCPSSELLGFMLCTVVAFEPSYDGSGGFQVKCTYHFKNDHADPCVLHCYFASCYGSLQKQSIRSDHLFLDMILVWMLQKIFGMVNSVKSQLNSPWKIWTTTPCIIVMWESVGSANYTPKQRTIAILSCHTVRYLQQLQRNLDSLYNNSLMLVGGKT